MKAVFAFLWIISLLAVVGSGNPAFLIPCLAGLVGFYICEHTTESAE